MKLGKTAIAIIALAVAVRIAIFYIFPKSVFEYLSGRIENMSPVTSFPRLIEGHHLLIHDKIDPYLSGYFKLNPIPASIVFTFIDNTTAYYTFLVVCDILSGIFLMHAFGPYSHTALVAFLFNPYTIVSEVGLSAESIDMLLVAILLSSRKLGISTLAIALLALSKPLVLFVIVFPVAVVLQKTLGIVILSTAAWTACLHALCYLITGGSYSFLKAYWSLHLITPDLEPTMGVAWNLFTMAFADSATFFRIVIFGHLLVVSVPLHWRFKKMYFEDQWKERAVRYFHLIVAAALLFQVYPTAINFALMEAILIACDDKFHDKVSKIMSGGVVFGSFFTSAAAPLWLERNTGNPNFLFYLDVVTTFLGILAVGQSLTATRLANYVLRDKGNKNKSE